MPQDQGELREDAWFREHDRELIEKLREDARRRAERERLAEVAGLEPDHEVLEDLLHLGFSENSVELLHLIPLVRVAWADGGVSAEERALIVRAARAHGVEEGSAADETLAGWLQDRPDDAFFGRALSIFKVLLGVRSEAEQEHSHRSLVGLCEELAAASGGLFGFGKVSAAEKAVIDEVAADLASHHGTAAKSVIDSL